MDTMGELLPFVKEMLNQKPSRQMLKIYMIGTTMAVLGVIGGLVESIFALDDQAEDTELWLEEERQKNNRDMQEKSVTALVEEDDADVQNTVLEETKDTHLFGRRRSSAYRLHAS